MKNLIKNKNKKLFFVMHQFSFNPAPFDPFQTKYINI